MVPLASILVPLAASKSGGFPGEKPVRWAKSSGTTDTDAPVSKRKMSLESRHWSLKMNDDVELLWLVLIM